MKPKIHSAVCLVELGMVCKLKKGNSVCIRLTDLVRAQKKTIEVTIECLIGMY